MGERFDALTGEVREAVRWMARRHMEEFGQRHPEPASIARSPSTIGAVQEDIASRDDLEDVLVRYKAAIGARTFKADTHPHSSKSSELPGDQSDASSPSQGVGT
jgi:hypothetical protein